MSGELPDGWQEGRSATGELYYHNQFTGQSSWERPIPERSAQAHNHRAGGQQQRGGRGGHIAGAARGGKGGHAGAALPQHDPSRRGGKGGHAGAPQHDPNKRPRFDDHPNDAQQPLALFNALRQRLLSKGGYLDLAALEQALCRQYEQGLPREIRDAIGGLQRIASSVNSALTMAFAAHHILTLRDLEAWVLASSRDFEGVASFTQLYLGPLGLHPIVQRHMPRAHEATVTYPHLAALDSIAVVSHIAMAMDGPQQGARSSFQDGLDNLTRELGLRDATELPLFIKAETFMTSLMSRCLSAKRRTEQAAERQVAEAAHCQTLAQRQLGTPWT